MKDFIPDFINNVFAREFKYARIGSWSAVDGHTGAGNLNYDLFYGTDFYAQPHDKKYIHFTKAKNALNIINSCALRLSNMNQFNDKLELILAASKLLKLQDWQFEDFKKRSFVTSFTELQQEENIYNSFDYHWTIYGDKHAGIALEFQFPSPNIEAVLGPCFYLMRIQYQNDFEENGVINRLNKELLLKEQSGDDIPYLALMEFLTPLLSAYKRINNNTEMYVDEKEIRLLFYSGNDAIDEYQSDNLREGRYIIYHNGEPTPIYQLPFLTPLKVNVLESDLNKFRLNKIYIGSKADKLITDIKNLAFQKGIECIEE